MLLLLLLLVFETVLTFLAVGDCLSAARCLLRLRGLLLKQIVGVCIVIIVAGHLGDGATYRVVVLSRPVLDLGERLHHHVFVRGEVHWVVILLRVVEHDCLRQWTIVSNVWNEIVPTGLDTLIMSVQEALSGRRS